MVLYRLIKARFYQLQDFIKIYHFYFVGQTKSSLQVLHIILENDAQKVATNKPVLNTRTGNVADDA